jgi:predicted DNA-binding antitoxin AbrB/MazE fold protein
MVCFEVKRNGARLYTAGINSKCILSAIVTHVDVIDPGPKPRRTLDLLVSGLNSETKQHMNWRRVDLKTGDRVEIRVIESTKADSPARITKSQTRKAVATEALARIRARRKALLGELRNLQRDELAYSRQLKTKQKQKKVGALSPK